MLGAVGVMLPPPPPPHAERMNPKGSNKNSTPNRPIFMMNIISCAGKHLQLNAKIWYFGFLVYGPQPRDRA
jgi:hypothetical protein